MSFNVPASRSSPNSSPVKTSHQSCPIFPRQTISSPSVLPSPTPSILFFYGANIRPISHSHKFLGGRWRIIRWNGGPAQCPGKWVKTGGRGKLYNGERYFYFWRGRWLFSLNFNASFSFLFPPPIGHSFN